MAFGSSKREIINRIKKLSDKYHNLSFVCHDLARSLEVHCKNMDTKEFKKYLKEEMRLDLEKLMEMTKVITEIKLGDIRKK